MSSSSSTLRLLRSAASRQSIITRPFNVSRPLHSTTARMGVQKLKSLDEFKALVDSGDKIIVDFKAVWCGPCKAISPIFEKLSDSADFENIKFVTVDVDEAPEISQEVGVSAMPTFITFNGGNKVGTLTGAIPAKLEELIKSVHAL